MIDSSKPCPSYQGVGQYAGVKCKVCLGTGIQPDNLAEAKQKAKDVAEQLYKSSQPKQAKDQAKWFREHGMPSLGDATDMVADAIKREEAKPAVDKEIESMLIYNAKHIGLVGKDMKMLYIDAPMLIEQIKDFINKREATALSDHQELVLPCGCKCGGHTIDPESDLTKRGDSNVNGDGGGKTPSRSTAAEVYGKPSPSQQPLTKSTEELEKYPNLASLSKEENSCPTCDGDGSWFDVSGQTKECPNCYGTGVVGATVASSPQSDTGGAESSDAMPSSPQSTSSSESLDEILKDFGLETTLAKKAKSRIEQLISHKIVEELEWALSQHDTEAHELSQEMYQDLLRERIKELSE